MPHTRGLADSLFVPFAHHFIANPDKTDGTWALRLMGSHNHSNHFVHYNPDSPETVPSFSKIKQHVVSFHSKNLPHLYENVYYIPTMVDHPLFDLFVVTFPPLPQPQCLWLLQMTTSKSHKGSQTGYVMVQEIIDQISQQGELVQPPPAKKPDLKGKGKAEEPLLVEINYVLVHPTGQEEHNWVLPEGWDEPNVYLLELPLDHDIDSVTTRAGVMEKGNKGVNVWSRESRSRRYRAGSSAIQEGDKIPSADFKVGGKKMRKFTHKILPYNVWWEGVGSCDRLVTHLILKKSCIPNHLYNFHVCSKIISEIYSMLYHQ
ncbi:uncharacterized protein LACBIDRAFT_330360 [Laccaria bicolor S238N-H82]|uniref:Predicted protein n=1 Tax=Laccaria bicolor (strain S238N-H82 / ATCC MYA-4686) TaxID=486041 RepID=B0DL24_LACBS|nr:uncharacterized protein LACBIDRAFT_330360 [Laccaria bicolor S238N-H82]EDR04835.1 predicted protein [Laccaria bicolor S238N-H82]|eukprot:XP_001884659.1 predicted protein [Laccaria bicolor S238N-H82]